MAKGAGHSFGSSQTGHDAMFSSTEVEPCLSRTAYSTFRTVDCYQMIYSYREESLLLGGTRCRKFEDLRGAHWVGVAS